jgi:hypothetical protein
MGERLGDYSDHRGNSFRGYEYTPELKKKVSMVSRSFKKAIKMSDFNGFRFQFTLNKPFMRKDWRKFDDIFYDEEHKDYRLRLVIFND